jgi:hypothetical protein
MFVFYECFVLSGRGLSDGPIPRLDETYLVFMCLCLCVCVCVSMSVIRCNTNPLHLQSVDTTVGNEN